MPSFWKKSTKNVNKFLEDCLSPIWHNWECGSKDVEFFYKGATYHLASTGTIYVFNHAGIPSIIMPYTKEYKGESVLCIPFANRTGYYVRSHKQIRLKDLMWAAFGSEDLPENGKIKCKSGNYRNCDIDNLEVIVNGIPR